MRVLTDRIIKGVDGVKLAAIRPDRHFRTSRQALLRWSAAVRGEQVVEVVRPERVTSGHIRVVVGGVREQLVESYADGLGERRGVVDGRRAGAPRFGQAG